MRYTNPCIPYFNTLHGLMLGIERSAINDGWKRHEHYSCQWSFEAPVTAGHQVCFQLISSACLYCPSLLPLCCDVLMFTYFWRAQYINGNDIDDSLYAISCLLIVSCIMPSLCLDIGWKSRNFCCSPLFDICVVSKYVKILAQNLTCVN